MKKIVSILVIFWILFFDISSVIAEDKTEDLPWKEAVDNCIKAAQDGNISAMWRITNPINPKLNLLCSWDKLQDIVYQAVLDVRFSKIDKDIENYLKWLDGNTNAIKANQELWDRFSQNGEQNQFYNAYQKACNQILTDTVKLLWTVDTWWWTKDIIWIKDTNKCLLLAQKKLNAYKNAWVVILARETAKSQENSWKSFFSAIRDKYEKLLMKFLNYISELWKISEKWNVSTPQAKNS